jgi:phosphopantothenate---cysteine ligase (CTP)
MDRLAIVTCGPAHEPVDAVRRITNLSTGEIGAVLADTLTRRGWRVVCFRGEGSTAPPPEAAEVRVFGTNEDLAEDLAALREQPDAVFHAAALCDFKVSCIEGADAVAKIPSSSDGLILHLVPAPKVLPRLRHLFPSASITGWKFECDGDRESAIAKGVGQIATSRTNACVVNGPAYGPGFGLVSATGAALHFPDKPALAAALADRLRASE